MRFIATLPERVPPLAWERRDSVELVLDDAALVDRLREVLAQALPSSIFNVGVWTYLK